MNHKKLGYLSSGFVGLASLTLLSLNNSNQSQAATQGTVNYKAGATTVWNSPNHGQSVKRYMAAGEKVTIQSAKKVYSEVWYNLGNDEWVSSKYIDGQAPAVAKEVKVNTDTVTANFKSGVTTVWADAQSAKPTGEYLPYGTTRKVVSHKVLNGATWYQIDSKGWVPAKYVVINNPSLTNVDPVDAPAVQVQPAVQTTAAPQAQEQAAATEQPAATNENQNQDNNQEQAATTNNDQAAASQATTQAPVQQQQTQAPTQTTTQAPAQQPQAQAPQQQSTPAPVHSGNAQTVVNAALSQVGVPYVWGGSTPGVGLDCSGLTQYAYSQAGVSLGHYTVSQEGAGRQVSLSALQPGDLLFWGSRGATYHCAIYIGGNQYVAAPQPGQSVSVQSISGYFMPSFGVRVF
ncbi:C40 family peptidase [Lactobacillus sp. DCY120]|uniref:C40 family peptidase n=1 Tax=Bombilactobacillus apium TaxID=2675299 RepID=A0A850RBI1_9LACO|nr:C40 family peptidase [Bombilactobacillus apium]NVY96676.1 C40 family peptidase [Bombilactobacillus apium]